MIVNQYAHRIMIKEILEKPCDLCPAMFNKQNDIICKHKNDFLVENNCTYDVKTGSVHLKNINGNLVQLHFQSANNIRNSL